MSIDPHTIVYIVGALLGLVTGTIGFGAFFVRNLNVMMIALNTFIMYAVVRLSSDLSEPTPLGMLFGVYLTYIGTLAVSLLLTTAVRHYLLSGKRR